MILRKALAREVLITAAAVTAIIFCIFLVVRVLGFLRQAAEGIIPVDSIPKSHRLYGCDFAAHVVCRDASGLGAMEPG